jgi:hypothetical protein
MFRTLFSCCVSVIATTVPAVELIFTIPPVVNADATLTFTPSATNGENPKPQTYRFAHVYAPAVDLELPETVEILRSIILREQQQGTLEFDVRVHYPGDHFPRDANGIPEALITVHTLRLTKSGAKNGGSSLLNLSSLMMVSGWNYDGKLKGVDAELHAQFEKAQAVAGKNRREDE